MYTKHRIIIILDSCNYTEFESIIKEFNFVGELSKVNTKCSTTQQWYNKYWQNKVDRILISENPMPFHKSTKQARNNFKESYMSFGDSWLNIDPYKTIDIYKGIMNKDDKYLLHFLSPHLPFICPKEAVSLMSKLSNGNIYRNTQNWGNKHGFDRLKLYYKDNIRNMLSIIYKNLYLFDNLLITSDHGELIGYMGHQYDHPSNPNNKQKEILWNVPYFEVDVNETLLNRRMEMLGYH